MCAFVCALVRFSPFAFHHCLGFGYRSSPPNFLNSGAKRGAPGPTSGPKLCISDWPAAVVRNSSEMNTCSERKVSTFKMNTYEKIGGG